MRLNFTQWAICVAYSLCVTSCWLNLLGVKDIVLGVVLSICFIAFNGWVAWQSYQDCYKRVLEEDNGN